MTQIMMQANGKADLIGRSEDLTKIQAQANGHAVSDGLVRTGVANLDQAPHALPETGLLGTTRIATPNGPVEIQELETGDLVTDANGDQVAVTHILKTPLTKTAICVRAPYFGLDQDLVVGCEHHIAITSDIAEYLFGAETVLVPIWAIKDGRKAQHWEMAPKTHLYQVQLEAAAGIKVGNCVLESMHKTGQSVGKVLTTEEARCFAAEHKSGYQS